ncbi:MAG: AAA family ATPase [Candidatus Nanosyncoccaceae bacterium]
MPSCNSELNTLEDVVKVLFPSLAGNGSIPGSAKTLVNALYAFNGTGKTRISRLISERDEDDSLCFNALFQDFFVWDNDNNILIINKNSWIVGCINEQGLQREVIDNFQKIYGSETIFPFFSSDSSEVTFKARINDSEDEDGFSEPIKVSKAEETLFILSIFYSLLQAAINELKISNPDDRSTDFFDNLHYIVIDDPVSSVDDTVIIRLSLAIFDLLNELSDLKCEQKIEVLIETHHALFFNKINDMLERKSKNIKLRRYILTKSKDSKYILKDGEKRPFGYHMLLREKIEKAIESDVIEKEHFNMFRILLEKTQLYFGYKQWDECIPEFDNKNEAVALMNRYSHFSEFESSELSEHNRDVFKEAFERYSNKYKPEVTQ